MLLYEKKKKKKKTLRTDWIYKVPGKMHFMDLNIWYQQIFTYSNKNYLPLQTTQYLLAL